MSDSSDLQCGATDNEISWFSLRVGSVFIILATSMSGALFPVLARKTKWIHVPKEVFEFAKYFGSGVIIATAFIHLLAPGFDELTSPCLSGIWGDYDWAPAIAMMAVFAVFLVELFAFRWGTAKLRALGVEGYDAHGHCAGPSGAMGAHGPEGTDSVGAPLSAGVARILPSEAELEAGEYAEKGIDSESSSAHDEPEHDHSHGHGHEHGHDPGHGHGHEHHPGHGHGHAHSVQGSEHTMTETSGAAQILGVAILEFGVIFHSVIIGLTLAVDENFIQLFIVIIFHQMFEGLGLGARLAFLDLPRAYRWAPLIGCIAYGVVTPIGIAAGLGVRSTYNPGSATASIVSGVLDSTSAGVLLYTGLVELLAHEFLFNPVMTGASNGRVVYAVVCMLVGAGIMALLGRWA